MSNYKSAAWCYQEGSETVCDRCGDRETMKLPMSMDALVKWSDYFMVKHLTCTPKPGWIESEAKGK